MPACKISGVGSSRRNVAVHDADRWVFNRMADVYSARPAYPSALIDALAELAGGAGGRAIDLGAGIGHVALPLAERGIEVLAVEPARAMLDVLAQTAAKRALPIRTAHAAAEALGAPKASAELVVIADALHFLDTERTAREVGRVLTRRGVLAIVTCEPSETPFMRAVERVMHESAPRRPRNVVSALVQLRSLARLKPMWAWRFDDAVPVDEPTLERILRSISFVGPAMNAERFAAFRARVQAIAEPPVWARTFTLHAARAR